MYRGSSNDAAWMLYYMCTSNSQTVVENYMVINVSILMVLSTNYLIDKQSSIYITIGNPCKHVCSYAVGTYTAYM